MHAPTQKKGRAMPRICILRMWCACIQREGHVTLYGDMRGIESVSDLRAFRRKAHIYREFGVRTLYIDMRGIESISDLRAFRRKGAQHSEDDQYCALIKRKEHRARVRRNIRFETNISENKANFSSLRSE